MIILTIRTDKLESEVGLFDDATQLGYETWEAHRQLAETIHTKIHDLLQAHGKDWNSIAAIIIFEGPGSFTGLRIGISVANGLGYGLQIPLVGAQGDDWIEQGRAALHAGKTQPFVVPHYGSDAHITTPKK